MRRRLFASVVILLFTVACSQSAKLEARRDSPEPRAGVAGWRTYHNERYGYSLRYPSSWRLLSPPANDDGRRFDVGDPDADVRVFGSPMGGPGAGRALQDFRFDDGSQGYLVELTRDDSMQFEVILGDADDDVSYHFFGRVPRQFYERNRALLLKVAKTLALDSKP